MVSIDVILSISKGCFNRKHVVADYGSSQHFAKELGKRRLHYQTTLPPGRGFAVGC